MEFNRFFSDQKYMNEMRPVFSKRALYSDTTENYVTPPEPAPYSRVKIAFRTKRSNVDRVFLVCKGQKNLMFKASSDAQFDYYEVKLQLDNEKISWYFEIQAGAITCYYDFRGVVKRPDEHYNFVLIPGFDTPDWAKGAVMYQIYVDRFCNGDPTNDVLTNEYHYIGAKSQHVEDWYRYPSSMDVRDFYGGDLQGVLDKMDYLEQLGVEVIYFNPLFVSPSNHKYDSQDYDHVDPHCGKIVKDGGRLLEDWEPELLVCGLPRTLAGEEGPQAARIRKEAARISDACGIPHVFADERLSSAEAKRSLREKGLTEKEMRGKVDMIAASLFLQSWLDERARA